MNEQERAIEIREAYITDLSGSLRERLAPSEAFEQLTEIREHLDSMALAFQELEIPNDAAMRMAIEKFGRAGNLGDKIVRAASAPGERRLALVPVGLIGLGLVNVTLAVAWINLFRIQIFNEIFGRGGVGPATGPHLLQLSIVATVVCWYVPKLRPTKAGLAGLAIASVGILPGLFRHPGQGPVDLILGLPYAYLAVVFGICFLSAYLAPKLRQSGLRFGRRPVA